MSALSFTSDYSDRTTFQVHQLGEIREEHEVDVVAANSTHSGARFWRYVKATAALAVGQVAKSAAGKAFEVAVGTQVAREQLIGVAQAAFAEGEYGWLLVRGVGEALSGAAVSADANIAVNGSGKLITTVFDDATATETYESNVGKALEAAGGADTLFAANFNFL